MSAGSLVVDDAYVISDLHLGGEAPRQMFCEGYRLGALIKSLVRPIGRHALVINGDFVDFLAERPSRHFDPTGAVSKLQRIASDPAFEPVFEALREFVSHPGHLLAIVLGNHDIELSLPWVRQELQKILCGDDEASAGRIAWSLDGEGVLLRIGSDIGPRVLCVHGNEVDGWNAVDHEAMRRLARDGLRDQRIDMNYVPNAGSRMVIEVMNDIKQRYPFVDLLKPETQAVVPILLALDLKAALALRALPALVTQQQAARARIALGWLGAIPGDTTQQADMMGSAPQPARLRSTVPSATRQAVRREAGARLLDLAEADLSGGRVAVDLLDADARADTLGVMSAAWSALTGGDRVEVLRAQLKELADQRSFSTLARDDTFRDMHARVSTNIDFLVTGHTHLARAIEREFGRAYYFNTGTWARVFRIDPATLKNAADFRTLFGTLGSSRVDALDSAPGLLPVQPHLAAFWEDREGVHGELRQMPPGTALEPVPVAGTRYTRKH